MQYTLTSIVMPVHNQADHIEPIVAASTRELNTALPAVPFELLLVTNACCDRSALVCQSLSERYAQVRTVDISRGGWGRAVKAGLAQARGDLLCYTNSARTAPETLAQAIKYAITNPDHVVKANRKIREGWRRRLGSLLYNLECRAFFDLATWDINGTPKVFPRAFAQLLELTRDDDLIDAEFNAICRRASYPMLEMPVHSIKRHGGKSTTNYTSAIKLYWGAFELWRNMRQPTAP